MTAARARPRVLQVAQPPDGGVARHVTDLVLGLRARGWPVEVAVQSANVHLAQLRGDGVPVHELELTRNPGMRDLSTARRLRRIDRHGGFGLVHAHSSKAGALVRTALPGRGRLVYTPHCFSFLAGLGGFRGPLFQAVEQLLVPRSAAIVAVSEWERLEAGSRLRGASSRLRTIHNGVGAPRPESAHPELLEWRGGGPLAAAVSVLRPQKDPLAVVRAAAALRSGPGLPGRFAVVGNGELRSRVISEIERLELRDAVRWFPFEASMGSYLEALDLLVVPSRWESFPIAALEAQIRGVPVLATAVGGMPEAVRDGSSGRLVPPDDDRALAAAVGELLSDPGALAVMGKEGRDWAARFSLERMLDLTEALYIELTG